MSGKPPEAAPKTDPRVRRTQHSLGDALIALIHEQPFDTITVQAVLERAGVSRSTFYAHYRDKDDLFMTEVDQFFQMMANLLATGGEVSQRVAPVRELFAHVAQMRTFMTALVKAGRHHDVFELGQRHFARGIEQRLAQLSPMHQQPSAPRAALAFAHAGAMLALMTWWLESGTPGSAAEMDVLFHQLVWGGAVESG
jgi:AcrR family transcriptional regulator